ncbi:hypothetical protein DUNSADRAFT_5681 [Dunaliella salina]|uniref:Uncharacterized protein n=1 Tax=Dunaliella salina TaxID=3046 RepID=A0ABQ7GPS2_DUNSA|nr:hypothetical protein DUNSADRAFT_5681 [Dunaliella salina]|eukprot:KAF5836607.1 hypothetical protein DUNSADRAFT_5681 [Dunaliella salina]
MLPFSTSPVLPTSRALKRGCLPPTAVRSSQQSNIDFPESYIPPGTTKWSKERGSLPLTPAQQRSPSPSPSPNPIPSPSQTPLQKLANGSEQRQWRLQQSFNLQARQQAAPGFPSDTPAASQSQGLQGSSLSDSQLDAVATQCLSSWFAGAPPPAPPQQLQPGVLDHEDPHVVSQAITSLMDSQQLEEAVMAVTYIVTKNRTRVLEL